MPTQLEIQERYYQQVLQDFDHVAELVQQAVLTLDQCRNKVLYRLELGDKEEFDVASRDLQRGAGLLGLPQLVRLRRAQHGLPAETPRDVRTNKEDTTDV